MGICVVASWVVLQFVDTLGGALDLPNRFASFPFPLLYSEPPVVLATAFVQEGGPGVGSHDGLEHARHGEFSGARWSVTGARFG